MAINTNPSSRRALLAAAAGGTVALVAESLARPLAARAGDDGDVVLGGVNESASTTTLRRSVGDPGPALRLENSSGWGALDASTGDSNTIQAVSDTKAAISAQSKQFIAIVGHAGEYDGSGGSNGGPGTTGVLGFSGAGTGVGGICKSGVGVLGSSETGVGVHARSKKIGVQGITEGSFDFEANRDVGGVLGESRSVDGVGGNGPGVEGRSETGIGVLGAGQVGVHGATGFPGGIGVEAKSETGPALHAIAAYPDQGARAIVAEGPVEFSSAGRGIIARGATQARVVSPVALSAEVSKILVTLLANPAGQMASSLSHVEIHESHQAFTVVLTAPAARKVPFAYFVIS